MPACTYLSLCINARCGATLTSSSLHCTGCGLLSCYLYRVVKLIGMRSDISHAADIVGMHSEPIHMVNIIAMHSETSYAVNIVSVHAETLHVCAGRALVNSKWAV